VSAQLVALSALSLRRAVYPQRLGQQQLGDQSHAQFCSAEPAREGGDEESATADGQRGGDPIAERVDGDSAA